MSVVVRIPTPLQKLVGDKAEVEAQGGTLREVIEGLAAQNAEIKGRLLDDSGELRRFSFFDHLLTQIEGVTASEATPGVRFHGENRGQEWDFHSPVAVTEKIRRTRMMTVEEYSYARAVARKPVKALLPSPLLLYTTWSREQSRVQVTPTRARRLSTTPAG